MLRTAASHEVAREVMQQTLHDSVQVAVARLVDDDADRRSALVMTQMAGWPSRGTSCSCRRSSL